MTTVYDIQSIKTNLRARFSPAINSKPLEVEKVSEHLTVTSREEGEKYIAFVKMTERHKGFIVPISDLDDEYMKAIEHLEVYFFRQLKSATGAFLVAVKLGEDGKSVIQIAFHDMLLTSEIDEEKPETMLQAGVRYYLLASLGLPLPLRIRVAPDEIGQAIEWAKDNLGSAKLYVTDAEAETLDTYSL